MLHVESQYFKTKNASALSGIASLSFNYTTFSVSLHGPSEKRVLLRQSRHVKTKTAY